MEFLFSFHSVVRFRRRSLFTLFSLFLFFFSLCPGYCGMSDGLCFLRSFTYGAVGAYECVRLCVTSMFGYISCLECIFR